MTDVELVNFIKNTGDSSRKMRNQLYVNCWHMNETESAAMWNLYAKTDEAVSVKTSFRKFLGQLPPWIMIGVVHYIDYTKEAFSFENGFNAVLRKRKSYEHEREIRAVLWEGITEASAQEYIPIYRSGNGFAIPLDLNRTIEEVYVYPKSPAWFVNIVKNLVKDYDLTVPVLHSSLMNKPIL